MVSIVRPLMIVVQAALAKTAGLAPHTLLSGLSARVRLASTVYTVNKSTTVVYPILVKTAAVVRVLPLASHASVLQATTAPNVRLCTIVVCRRLVLMALRVSTARTATFVSAASVIMVSTAKQPLIIVQVSRAPMEEAVSTPLLASLACATQATLVHTVSRSMIAVLLSLVPTVRLVPALPPLATRVRVPLDSTVPAVKPHTIAAAHNLVSTVLLA